MFDGWIIKANASSAIFSLLTSILFFFSLYFSALVKSLEIEIVLVLFAKNELIISPSER